MRIAIIGGGVSGLVAADGLRHEHDVHVFEAEPRLGGHVHTVQFDDEAGARAVDTGFIVFNEHNYPEFTKLLDRLGVGSRETQMGLSVRCDRTGLEYNGENLDTLFVQRRNLLRPRFLGMVRDIVRFYRQAREQMASIDPDATVRQFADRFRYGEAFVHEHLVPMGSSLWSCPPRSFLEFPMRFVLKFFANHRMLQIWGRPVWRTVAGGSFRYVEELVRPFRERIRLDAPVEWVKRGDDGVELRAKNQEPERFDEVVFACHSDQALRILQDDATERERDILGPIAYQANETVLHTDTSVLPRRKRGWAAWNYRLDADEQAAATVTYDMNILQGLRAPHEYCVTLNDTSAIDPAKVVRRQVFEHPVYPRSLEAIHARRDEMLRQNRTSFCGAYWGFGFHEDGVRSGLEVARAFGKAVA